MNQLTIRGFGKELDRKLREISREHGVSLNKAALYLMGKGAGLSDEQGGNIGDALDEFIGSWTSDQAKEFQRDAAGLDEVDSDFWT